MKKLTLINIVLFSLFCLNAKAQIQVIEEWVNIFKGVDEPNLISAGLAIDVNDNVYVTGVTLNSLTGGDFVTIKYNKSGDQLWLRTFSSAGKFNDGGDAAIVLDRDCNAYVAGEYRGGFATIKYDSLGNQKWAAIHDSMGFSTSLGAIVLDEAGNVYITGQSRRDFVTIKYDNDGNRQWIATFDDPSFIINRDIPFDMAVDKGGNVYVTGAVGSASAFTTIKYDANGIEQWIVKEDAVGIPESSFSLVIDASSNVYILGIKREPLFYKVVAIKYDKDGNQLWRREHTGDTIITRAILFFSAIKVDANNNVYVTAPSGSEEGGLGFATIKYDQDGNEQWVSTFDRSPQGNDVPIDLALDKQGNVYVTGRTGESGSTDFATIRYDNDGNEEWVELFNGPADGNDFPFSMALDRKSNVYVTGVTAGQGTIFDMATIKYRQIKQVPPPVEVFVDEFDDGKVDGSIYRPMRGAKLKESDGRLKVSPRNGEGGVSITNPLTSPALNSNNQLTETGYNFQITPSLSDPSDQMTIKVLGDKNKLIETYTFDNTTQTILLTTGTKFGATQTVEFSDFEPNDTNDLQFSIFCRWFNANWTRKRCTYTIEGSLFNFHFNVTADWLISNVAAPQDPTLSDLSVSGIEIVSNKPFDILRFEIRVDIKQPSPALLNITVLDEFVKIGSDSVTLVAPTGSFDGLSEISLNVDSIPVLGFDIINSSTLRFLPPPNLSRGPKDLTFSALKIRNEGDPNDTLFDILIEDALIYHASSQPLTLSRDSLPVALNTKQYSSNITATGGDGTHNFRIVSGTLPKGLVLQSDGTISGKPTVKAGVFPFYVSVTDNSGEEDVRLFFIEVKKRPGF